MSGARTLFDQLREGGLELIQRIVSETWHESPVIDFKTLDKDSAPLTKNGRRTLAEALSGFANSDGGVIVWGIYAYRDRQLGLDVARELRPIDGLQLLLSELHGLTPQLVSPGVEGVEHHAITETTGIDVGFVVTFVPRSESAIHMAMGADQHRFYYRAGSSFLPMEAFMVADRLGRRPQPRLELACRLERGSSTPSKQKVVLILGMRNVGQGLALYPALGVQEPPNWSLSSYGLDGNGRKGLPERVRSPIRADDTNHLFAGGSDAVVHPETVLEITRLVTEVPHTCDDIPDVIVQHELYCEGFSYSGEVTVPVLEFVQSLRDAERGQGGAR